MFSEQLLQGKSNLAGFPIGMTRFIVHLIIDSKCRAGSSVYGRTISNLLGYLANDRQVFCVSEKKGKRGTGGNQW